MEWSDLRIFLTAVRAGSYTAAGPALGMNRTTVGRRIAALEASLGTPVFRSTPSGEEPTRVGRLLLDSAVRIEAEVARLAAAIGAEGMENAPLRIASSAGIAVEFMADLAAFGRDHPHARLELTGALDPIEAVTQRRADLAIALVRSVPRRLVGERLATLRQARYARRGAHAPARLGWGAEVELALPRHWTAANTPPPGDPAVGFNNWATLKQATIEGFGSAWLWCFAADAEPLLERIDAPDPRYDTDIWLLHRADTPQSALGEALTRFLGSAIRARIGGSQAV